GVGRDELLDRRMLQPLDRLPGEQGVGTRGIHHTRTSLVDDLGGTDYRTSGEDLVVDDDRRFALHLADHAQRFAATVIAEAPLLDERNGSANHVSKVTRPFG